jgi:ABA4-like protein
MNTIFRLSNFLVLPFWAPMMVLPRWRCTERIMKSFLVVVGPALVYGTLVLPHLAVIWPAVTRPTLAGVAQLLGSPMGATIAWAHFLAFDLFVGRWIYWDSRERRISPVLISPVLFLTLMLGPLGFLLYLAVRTLAQKKTSQQEPSAGALNSSVLARTDRVLAIGHWLRRGFAVDRPLTILGCVMVLTLLGTIIGLMFDPRVITGAPAWLKPAKFSISVSVYCFTLVWLLGFLKNRRRFVQIVTRAIVFSLAVEMIVIITQAARGTTSHFNMSTPLNSFLWITMGAFIVVVWVMTLVLTIALIRQPISDKAFARSLRLGLIISLVGMATGFFMVRPTPEQRPSAHNPRPKIVGAHNVGVADGGPGLPVVGWSTVAGDMRVAHFVGLHGLQVLPLLGWLITRSKRRRAFLNDKHRLALVWIAGLAYTGILVLLAWQALRGESVIHPDGTLMWLAGALISATAIAIWAVIRGALSEHRAGRRTKM